MRKQFLSNYQVVVMSSVSFLPLMFWVYPRDATEFARIDGQWAVLGACILGLFSAFLHGLLNRRFLGCSASEMLAESFGTILGKILMCLFIPGYILFVAVSMFSFSIILTDLLPTSPRIATMAAMILIAAMGAKQGVETVARVASFVFPGTIIVLCTACLYVSMRGSFTGITFHPASISASLYGSVRLLPLFFGLNIYLVLNQHFVHRRNNPISLILIATGIATLTLLFVYLATALTLGYAGMREVARPVQFIMQLARMPGFIIERFGLVFIVLVTLFETVFCSTHLWALSKSLGEVLNLRPELEKWTVWCFAVVLLVVFAFIPNQTTNNMLLQQVLFPLSLLYLLIEPTVKLIVAYMRGRPRQQTGVGKPT